MAVSVDFTQPDPEGRFADWVTGQFDSLTLTKKQSLSLQHLREELGALKRKADALSSVRASCVGRAPLAHEKTTLRDLTFDFHHAAYAAIGSMQAAFSKSASHLHPKLQVPPGMVETFLQWLDRWRGLPSVEQAVPVLRMSRDYRSIVAHAQQRQTLDWATAGDGPEGPAVLLFGGARTEGQVPDGVRRDVVEIREWVRERHDDGAEIFWLADPPDEQSVVQALFALVMEFGSLAGGMTHARANGLAEPNDRVGFDPYVVPADHGIDPDEVTEAR